MSHPRFFVSTAISAESDWGVALLSSIGISLIFKRTFETACLHQTCFWSRRWLYPLDRLLVKLR